MVYDTRVSNVIVAGETVTHSSATPESSQCYLHKRDKTRPTIWRSIKVTDSVPGRRHGDPESSSVLVNRPLSSLTTSNVPRSLYTPPPTHPPTTFLVRPPVVVLFCATLRPRARPPLCYILYIYCHLPHVRRLAAATATAVSFVRSRRQSNFSSAKQTRQSLCAYTRTHTHPHALTDRLCIYTMYAQRLGRGGCRGIHVVSTRTTRTRAGA